MTKKPTKTDKKLSLHIRLEPELHKILKKMADKNGRTLTKQAEIMLKACVMQLHAPTLPPFDKPALDARWETPNQQAHKA